MKAARLVSEIVILGALSRPVTAAALADRLEVTERTIYRDIGDLSRIGVPVITESGPGGGISLLGTWTSPLSGMTRDELDSVLIGSLAAADLGLGSDLAHAREKILTETDSAFSSTVLVDGPDWFMAQESSEALSTIVAALRQGRGLRVDYSGGKAARARTLIPLGLVIKSGRWYLVAQAPGGRARTYRVARIASPRLRFVSVTPPRGFDLGAYWSQSQVEFDRSIRTTVVTLRVPEMSLEDLVRSIPGHVTSEAIAAGSAEGAHRIVDLPMEPVEIAASQLLAVPGVEVIAPAQLRAEVGRRASTLAALNSASGQNN